jgi:hypothetical protein
MFWFFFLVSGVFLNWARTALTTAEENQTSIGTERMSLPVAGCLCLDEEMDN